MTLSGSRNDGRAAQWERTWDLQRGEDATGQRLHIPVP
jgi:hypothetical protein